MILLTRQMWTSMQASNSSPLEHSTGLHPQRFSSRGDGQLRVGSGPCQGRTGTGKLWLWPTGLGVREDRGVARRPRAASKSRDTHSSQEPMGPLSAVKPFARLPIGPCGGFIPGIQALFGRPKGRLRSPGPLFACRRFVGDVYRPRRPLPGTLADFDGSCEESAPVS